MLLVLDNFPVGEELSLWLPSQSNIYTLVTTRRKDFFNYFSYELQTLLPQDALRLLNSGHRSFTLDEALPLLEALDGLPLALELARHYLNQQPELSITQFLVKMNKLREMHVLDIFAEKYSTLLPINHAKQVSATFRMSLELATPFQQQLLWIISSLAPMPVPRRILTAILLNTKTTPELSSNLLQNGVDEAISYLNSHLSMLELDEDRDPRIHPLLAAFVRTTLESNTAVCKDIITAIRNEMARASDEKDTRSFHELEKILPHAHHVLTWQETRPEQAINIANYMGWHHKNLGRYRLGETYRRKALELAEKHFPPGDSVIATQQSNLALVLKDLGELEEARDLLRESLASYKKIFPLEHPYIARSQSNLALVLQDLGELTMARDLLRVALAADKYSFPAGHPSIARSQSNLAAVLQALGELAEARDLLREALNSNKHSFPTGHPAIAISQSNLAVVLQALGELPEARDLLREALAADKKSFPPNHPSIAIRQVNLAMVLADLGEFPEAIELLTLAYHTLLEKWGPDHPSTQRVKKNLDSLQNNTQARFPS